MVAVSIVRPATCLEFPNEGPRIVDVSGSALRRELAGTHANFEFGLLPHSLQVLL